MRYAIIADVHGNEPALKTVLRDAEAQGVDHFLFAGDYCISGSRPDECVDVIRQTPCKQVIRGNEEGYFENLIGKDQSAWTDGQMQITYWSFRQMKPENLDYLIALPSRADFTCNGVSVHMAHASRDFLGDREFELWGPMAVADKLVRGEVTADTMQSAIQKSFDEDASFQKAAGELADGIYIFGHSHIQWSYRLKDRNIWFVNPGSCGNPLDGKHHSAPYAIISISEDGRVEIEERRCPFDTDKYIDSLMCSPQHDEARVWSDVFVRELRTAREHICYFLGFTERYAQSIRDDRRPFAVDTWEKAYAAYAAEGSGKEAFDR